MKTISVRQLAAVKRNAQNVSALVVKKNKLIGKVTELKNEYDATVAQIDAYEAGTKAITGGYTSEQLVNRVIETKTDANGKEVKLTKYIPKTEVLVWDEDKKVYMLVEENDQQINPNFSHEDTPVDYEEATVDMVEGSSFDPTFGAAENVEL